ncbi:hypothetical protein PCASD_26357 [Puccinia coronata f. sp. avenae]|uniref:Tet-like 2OG-Fe(II) oxygenase domain-containing protein n=1 Tax=Puccinia coronata f. sp. avenae TaxID=200324 RepID=A0A2N5THL3_9BASI|nr:hypothetical protein PCASD_26357 [Puccinia coronata f. sp. avenae]
MVRSDYAILIACRLTSCFIAAKLVIQRLSPGYSMQSKVSKLLFPSRPANPIRPTKLLSSIVANGTLFPLPTTVKELLQLPLVTLVKPVSPDQASSSSLASQADKTPTLHHRISDYLALPQDASFLLSLTTQTASLLLDLCVACVHPQSTLLFSCSAKFTQYCFHPPLLLLASSLLWLPWTVTDFVLRAIGQSTSKISKLVPQDLCSSLELRFAMLTPSNKPGRVDPRGRPVLSGECTVPQSSRSFKGGSTGSCSTIAPKPSINPATCTSHTINNQRQVDPRGRPVLSGECTVPQSSRSFNGGSTGSCSTIAPKPSINPATCTSHTINNQRQVDPRGRPVLSGECTVPQSSRSFKGGSTGLPSDQKRHLSPPKYPSKTAKRIAKLARRGLRDSIVQPHFIRISPSEEIISPKPLETLPHIGKKSRNLVCRQGGGPYFILKTHSFPDDPLQQPSPTFLKLSEIISDLYKMALHRQPITINSNLLNGKMYAIGFCQGSDRRKSGGTYARDRDISIEESVVDSALWKKLNGHNDFIASRIKSLSQSAWAKNHKVARDYAIPNWSQEEWIEFKKDLKFAGNVTVTMDDFYNKVHQDNKDLNPYY